MTSPVATAGSGCRLSARPAGMSHVASLGAMTSPIAAASSGNRLSAQPVGMSHMASLAAMTSPVATAGSGCRLSARPAGISHMASLTSVVRPMPGAIVRALSDAPGFVRRPRPGRRRHLPVGPGGREKQFHQHLRIDVSPDEHVSTPPSMTVRNPGFGSTVPGCPFARRLPAAGAAVRHPPRPGVRAIRAGAKENRHERAHGRVIAYLDGNRKYKSFLFAFAGTIPLERTSTADAGRPCIRRRPAEGRAGRQEPLLRRRRGVESRVGARAPMSLPETADCGG